MSVDYAGRIPTVYTKASMQRFKLLFATALTGFGVALTYYYFEAVVHAAIDFVWIDQVDTDGQRLLVIPVSAAISLLYFGIQHQFDPKSEQKESHGLGDMPRPTVVNFSKVLAIGFLSLLAGASLGPEAILVPACMILGSYIGLKLLGPAERAPQLLGMAGFVALCAAFFNSFLIGMLALLLAAKQAKLKLSPFLVVIAAVASASTVWVLNLLSSKSFVSLPTTSWSFEFRSLLAVILLVVAGYLTTYLLGWSHRAITKVHQPLSRQAWWLKALAASAGLSVLYLIGGPLVEFTGNESITPMLQQAAQLGMMGLAWLVIVKIVAISWSKAMGYRGGLVFPTIFIASVLAAIAHDFVISLNFIYGLIAVMVGVLAAERKVKILF